ncbi:hypothetical protein EX30DRAFT_164920 [Ascodesmis nigricans]|uniref:Uncharacterized protein n=1 Tax=Ascodesmis nigricans TaxID=341454 RepID=A0A4S2MMG7_9PEZI|nr:hypothetical protein EX30DRAFT_164920 [Ascodesmis nigricans]
MPIIFTNRFRVQRHLHLRQRQSYPHPETTIDIPPPDLVFDLVKQSSAKHASAPPPPFCLLYHSPRISSHQSPPARLDSDLMDVLGDYIDWTARKVPCAEDDLVQIYDSLRALYQDVDNLKGFKYENWDRLGVPMGLGGRLTPEVHKFQKERRKRTYIGVI